MIAASASLHKLIVVTRNVADYKHLGVKVLNPFVSFRKYRLVDGAGRCRLTRPQKNCPDRARM